MARPALLAWLIFPKGSLAVIVDAVQALAEWVVENAPRMDVAREVIASVARKADPWLTP